MANVVVLCFILTLAALHGSHSVEYTVTDKAGTVRFENEIGAVYAKRALDSASNFIWRILHEPSLPDRKNVTRVGLLIESMSGVAYETNNEIHVSAAYVEDYSGDVKREITGVLYHETTHIWQWNGNGQAPGGLIEGMADYVRLKAGYGPSGWARPGQGDRWDQGYVVTARFLDYCGILKSGFVAELNKKMRNGYSVRYFDQILGKSVDQLWKDYKAKFNK